MVITKGDLLHQETKVARSGLAELFWRVEIVSEKDEATYRRILERHGVDPATFVMVGNSVRSDVLPVLAIGGRAVHVPYPVTWALEHAEPDPDLHDFPVLTRWPSCPRASTSMAGRLDAVPELTIASFNVHWGRRRDATASRRSTSWPPARRSRRRHRAPGDLGARRRRSPSTTQVADTLGMRCVAVPLARPRSQPEPSCCGRATGSAPATATGASRCSPASRSVDPHHRAPPAAVRPVVAPLLHAEIDVDGTNLAVVGTHFAHLEFGAPLQTRAPAARAPARRPPAGVSWAT